MVAIRAHDILRVAASWQQPPATLEVYYEYPEELTEPALFAFLPRLVDSTITYHEIPVITMTEQEFWSAYEELLTCLEPVDLKLIGHVSHATERLLGGLPSTVLYEYD
jgi:hypothetical protein